MRGCRPQPRSLICTRPAADLPRARRSEKPGATGHGVASLLDVKALRGSAYERFGSGVRVNARADSRFRTRSTACDHSCAPALLRYDSEWQ